MKQNAYRADIVGACAMSAVVLPLETWRRWGELLSPAALDDFTVFGAAMVVAVLLARRHPVAPALWVFVCGGGWFMMVLSVWGSIYSYGAGDPSGVPVALVLVFKLVLFALVGWVSVRAVRRIGLDDPYAGPSARPDRE
ncbi:MAG: hypothetical protein AAFP86_05275 [Planctomycetota bacterium]